MFGIYVGDQRNHRIRKITPQGSVVTLAGSCSSGFADGPALSAQFNFPYGVAVDSTGNVLVADHNNHRIRRISPQGYVTTVAGSGTTGHADGIASIAKFDCPSCLAVDPSHNIFVGGSNCIRKITPQGDVVTISVNQNNGTSMSTGGTTQPYFNKVRGIVLDSTGNLFVADTFFNRVRKITPQGLVTTLVGSTKDVPCVVCQLSAPGGVAIDSLGNVLISDTHNNIIRKAT
eukprot:TRINITY_DN19885_c0_g2_i1.p1 TRINITY_DN19885_c0_g2~~TRINITY_DN19885_c0_g2_i1.p1  ORF type:complete len:231 (-),score=24.93 TRINITY_DN19885_c0_g2_i1:47-739(-)